MAPIRPVLHQLSCSNETVRNALKYEFWVQWSGSGAFIAKNSNATLFSELVRSLRKILTQLRLVNLCVNGAISASFASTFLQ
jgi:hypothetical protein